MQTQPRKSIKQVAACVSLALQPLAGAKQMEVVLDKITIPSPALHVQRPRLMNILSTSLDSCASTVITGRAGVGKTSLVAAFAETCGRSISWYKVDASDAELSIFLNYLAASIRTQRPSFTLALERLLSEKADRNPEFLANCFAYQLLESNGNPLLVVIEDLHMISDADWLSPFLVRLLPLLPADIHLLLTSRTVLPAPIWRMRSKQTLAVIEEGALTFTPQEAIDLFRSYGLSDEHVHAVLAQANGRVAKLSAAAIDLRRANTINHSPNLNQF